MPNIILFTALVLICRGTTYGTDGALVKSELSENSLHDTGRRVPDHSNKLSSEEVFGSSDTTTTSDTTPFTASMAQTTIPVTVRTPPNDNYVNHWHERNATENEKSPYVTKEQAEEVHIGMYVNLGFVALILLMAVGWCCYSKCKKGRKRHRCPREEFDLEDFVPSMLYSNTSIDSDLNNKTTPQCLVMPITPSHKLMAFPNTDFAWMATRFEQPGWCLRRIAAPRNGKKMPQIPSAFQLLVSPVNLKSVSPNSNKTRPRRWSFSAVNPSATETEAITPAIRSVTPSPTPSSSNNSLTMTVTNATVHNAPLHSSCEILE